MKHNFLYLIIIGLCVLNSCQWQKRGSGALPKELVQAENIMYENPDSALQILQGMEIPVGEEAHATWALLLTQAKYKCFVEQSDSLVNIAYDYFVQANNIKRKTLSLYLRGGLLYDKNQYEKALDFYIEADKEIDKISNDTLRFLINSHICMIYAYKNLYDYAIEYGWKSNKYAIQSQNPKYLVLSFIRIARANSDVNIEESIKCYEKAVSIAEEYGFMSLKATALVEVAGRYYHNKIKDYDKALFYIKEAMKIKETDQSYIALGDLYRKTNKIDSAYFYFRKAAVSSNIYTSRNAYQGLFYMSQELGYYKKAVKFSRLLWQKQDSINSIAREKALIEMQEKRNELNALNEQLTENKDKIAQNEERMKIIAQAESEDIAEELQEKETAIENMRVQNEALKKNNKELQEKIEQHENILKEKSKDTERFNQLTERSMYLRKREVYLSNQLLKKDEMITKLKKEPHSLDNNQWQELREKTDALFDGYTERLLEKIPTLTTHDIHICCLIKLSFSHIAIADILGISPTSVSRQKQRLKERIVQQVGPLGENVLLDIWLKEF